MKILWDKILSQLNCNVESPNIQHKQPCPLHPNSAPTLTVTEDADTAHIWCSCDYCNFSGTIISLIATKLQIPIATLVNLFLNDPKFANTIVATGSEENIKQTICDYINYCQSSHYLKLSHKALKESILGRHMTERLTLARLIHPDLDYLPPEVGLAIKENIPEEFTELYDSDIGKDLICTYTYNNKLSGINIINEDRVSKTFIGIDLPAKGVFLERYVDPDATKVILVDDELTALAVHTKSKCRGLAPLPVITTRGFPLPATFKNVSSIQLIHYKSNPLPLKKALNYLNHTHTNTLIENSTVGRVHISVVTPGAPLESYGVEDLGYSFESHSSADSLPVWIATNLIAVYNTHGISNIYNLLTEAQLNKAAIISLAAGLSKYGAPDELVKLVSENLIIADKRVTCSGLSVIKTPAGFIGYTGKGSKVILSNTSFTVNNKTTTKDGDIYCKCTLLNQDTTIPALNAVITYDTFTNSKTLESTISREYAKRGYAPSVIFYTHSDFSWREICDLYTTDTKAAPSVNKLGIDDTNRLQLPGYTINPNGAIARQSNIMTVDTELLTNYSGVSADIPNLFPYRKLWEAADTYSVTLSLIISHILYHMLLPRLTRDTHTAFNPKQLCLVDTSGYFDELMSNINLIFNGSYVVKAMPLIDKRTNDILKYTQLGGLPIICDATNTPLNTLDYMLNKSGVNFVCTINTDQACDIDNLNDISYIIRDVAGDKEKGEPISTQSIEELQKSFVSFAANLMLCSVNTKQSLICAKVPAAAMHRFISKLLGIRPNKAITALIKSKYKDTTQLANTLLAILKQYIQNGSLNIKPILLYKKKLTTGMLRKYSSKLGVILISKDIVCVSELLMVKLINAKQREHGINQYTKWHNIYGTQHKHILADPAVAAKLTAYGERRLRYMLLKRSVWDKHVVSTDSAD